MRWSPYPFRQACAPSIVEIIPKKIFTKKTCVARSFAGAKLCERCSGRFADQAPIKARLRLDLLHTKRTIATFSDTAGVAIGIQVEIVARAAYRKSLRKHNMLRQFVFQTVTRHDSWRSLAPKGVQLKWTMSEAYYPQAAVRVEDTTTPSNYKTQVNHTDLRLEACGLG